MRARGGGTVHTKRGPGPPLPGRRTPGGVGGGGGRRLRDTAGRALPRGRRENAGNQSPLPLIHDSSPRERGKRVDAVHPHTGVGLIPAHAGNTRREILYADPRSGNPPWASLEIIDRRKARAMGPAPAHPRAGVENTPRIPATASCCGSSPCGRGKRRRAVPGAAGQRLIPARAGKTPSPRQCPATSSAHPRAGGENSRTRLAISRPPGSSPRVRGKLIIRWQPKRAARLIPARAGKTTPSPPATCAVTAHPRACGENWTRASIIHPPKGSSPRVRGKPGRACPPGEGPGLIPACAGKTCQVSTRRRTGRAHPRVCGENLVLRVHAAPGRGSSPRVRGKRPRVLRGSHTLRLIPARAGKTADRSGRRY